MRQTIEDEAQRLPSQMFSSLISRMVESGVSLLTYDPRDLQYKKVGLVVLDCMLDVSDELMPERRIAIANQLKNVLENDKQNIDTSAEVLRIAAASIGHLARVASTTEIEFLQDFYVTNAIKWLLEVRSEPHRFSGLLILTQLAINSPALIFTKRKEYFKAIWDVMFDKNQMIREAASESLQAALILVAQRDNSNDYHIMAIQQIEIGFASSSLEKIHGSMLILDCLLSENVISYASLHSTIRSKGLNIHDMYWEVFQRKDNRDVNIKLKVLELIPKMAAASPSSFLQQSSFVSQSNFLTYSIRHLLAVIQSGRERPAAYVSLGGLFTALSSALKVTHSHIIDDVFGAIKEGLKEPFCVEAMQCLGVVVKSSVTVREYVDSSLVNALFQGGLTSELIKCLKIIVKNTPSIRGEVQTRLRSHITHILLNHSVTRIESDERPRSATNGSRKGSMASPMPSTSSLLMSFWQSKPTTTTTRQRGVSQPEDFSTDSELILALQVLASFDFLSSRNIDVRFRSTTSSPALMSRIDGKEQECGMLLRVVREGVVRYLDDSNPAIRDAAAVTCAKVLDKVVDAVEASTDGDKYLIQVMDRLLMLGVGDESEEIRAHVFQSLPSSLDHVISTAQNVHCLIEAMNDESFSVRAAAMSVLSRVAHYDAVHIMPLVRLVLSKLMRQLHNSKDHLLRQENVQLLQEMVRGTNILIVPYVKQVIEPLLILLDDPSPAIVGAALSTIGELSLASPNNVKVHLPELFPRLIHALNDQSSISKQEIAVVALGKIISALILPYDPYVMYPTLFGSIVKVIQSAEVSALSLRTQAIKTVGLLGAVDAEVYQRSLRGSTDNKVLVIRDDEAFSMKNAQMQQADDENPLIPAEDEEDDVLLTSDKYYLYTVMKALMNILSDSSLSSHHQAASTVAIRITRILGYQIHLLLDDVVNGITYRYRNCEPGSTLQETLIDHLVTLVYVVGRDISKHVDTICILISESYHLHLKYCLDMIEALCFILLPQNFINILRIVLPPMLEVMKNELLSDDELLLVTRIDNNVATTTNNNTRTGQSIPKRLTPLPNTSKILTTISNISPNLGEYRRQLIPVILKVMEQTGVRPITRKEALCTVMHLALDSEELHEFASRILHPILRLILSPESILQTSALTALSFMVCRLKNLYVPYIIPAKRKTAILMQQKDPQAAKPFQLEEYESLVAMLLGQRYLPSEPSKGSSINMKNDTNLNNRLDGAKNVQHALRIEYKALETASALSERNTASDLVEWMRRLSIEVIRQSPSPILRHCAALAKLYMPLAQELFNAAFISIWDEVFTHADSDVASDIPLIRSLENALRSPQIPANIRDALLNLAEFMEMQDKPLPIDVLLLAEQARLANMFAKCLHYRELEFNCSNALPSTKCIEALIIVNDQLGMREAAGGVLQCVRLKYKHIDIEPLWLEKLNRWEDAREAYLKQIGEWRHSRPKDTPAQHEKWMATELGLLRCLHALGDYEELTDGAISLRTHINTLEGQVESADSWMSEVQRLGANAAWMLGQWDTMGDFLEEGSLGKIHDVYLESDGSFYSAIMAIHKNEFGKATKLINDSREAMIGSISSILNESYSRAYRSMVTMQVLSEMEELIEYKITTNKILQSTHFTEKDISMFYSKNKKVIEDGYSELLYIDREDEENQNILFQVAQKRSVLMRKWRKRLKSAPREVDVYRLILVRTYYIIITLYV
jgi:FKBP12-rapamycin complex-associated protein